jgi:hypothetical protein
MVATGRKTRAVATIQETESSTLLESQQRQEEPLAVDFSASVLNPHLSINVVAGVAERPVLLQRSRSGDLSFGYTLTYSENDKFPLKDGTHDNPATTMCCYAFPL